MPLGVLKRWPKNPKEHDGEVIGSSLTRFGYVDPIVIDEKSGRMVKGHGRLEQLEVMKQAGKSPPARIELKGKEWLVPVVRGIAFRNQREAEAYLLVDNRSTELGGWNDDLLPSMLRAMRDDGVQIDDLGWDAKLLEKMLRQTDTKPGEDEIPEAPEHPVSEPGTLYELGPHRLLCGDATKDLPALLGKEHASLVVTSPPYNQGLDRFKPSGMQKENPAWVKRMAGAYPDSRPEHEYQAEQVAVVDALLAVTTPNASLFYNHKHRYRDKKVLSPMQWLERTRWALRQEIIWDRGSSVTLNARMFMPQDERIYWLTRGDNFTFNDRTEIKAWGTVWKIAPRAEEGVTAPFPIELPTRCIDACSARGEIILDPYGGSGTTLIAAATLERRAFLLELDPRYCDVIRRRWTAYALANRIDPGRGAIREAA